MAFDGGSYTLKEFIDWHGRKKGLQYWHRAVWRAVGSFQSGKPVDGALHTAQGPVTVDGAAGASQPFVTEPADPPPGPDSCGEAHVAAGASQPGRQVAEVPQPAWVPITGNGAAGDSQLFVTEPGDPPPCPGSSGDAGVSAGASQPGGSGNVAISTFPLQ